MNQPAEFSERVGQRSLEIYSDPEHPAGFSHAKKILPYIRQDPDFRNAKLDQIQSALESLPAYSKHQQLKNREFPKMTTRSDDVNERWQVDLMATDSLKPELNNGVRFLLIIIDVFSRSIIVTPLKDKTGKETSSAFEMVLMTGGVIPDSVASDSGREFGGRAFRELCKKYGIKQYFTVPEETHASVVERVIKTLRLKVGKYMSLYNTERYIDVLPEIVSNYNDSVHSTLGTTPRIAASSLANRQLALFHLKRRLNEPYRKINRHTARNLQEGSIVRIPLPFKRFRKAHKPKYSEAEFLVKRAFVNDKSRMTTRLAAIRSSDASKLRRPAYYPSELPHVSS